VSCALAERDHHALSARALWLSSLAFALLIHSTLPDYEQREWGGQRAWLQVSAIALLCSSLMMCTRGGAPKAFSAWATYQAKLSRWAPCVALSALMLHKLWTLLTLRDVLTQSMILLCLCAIALISSLPSQAERLSEVTLKRARDVTALTYVGAALHKLNTTFLASAQSCALHGVEVSFELIGLPWPEPPHMSLSAVDALVTQLYQLSASPLFVGSGVIAVELALACALWRGERWLWPLGLLFHLPLTLTIAPSFSGVMFCGYVASTLLRVPSIATLSVARATLGAGVALWICFGPMGEALKALSLCALAVWGWLALAPKASPQSSPRSVTQAPPLVRRLLMTITAVYGLHLLSPYLGVEVQHSGAMLSNLRIDPACFNSLVAPRVGWDPYIRIEEAQLGRAERPKKVKVLREQLWGWAALNTIRRNWCSPTTSPFVLRGSWGGEPFEIDDLCASGGLLELEASRPLQTSLPVGWQRLQKNLSRRCDQACVH